MGKAGVASGLAAAGAFSAAGGVGSDGPPAEGEEGATEDRERELPVECGEVVTEDRKGELPAVGGELITEDRECEEVVTTGWATRIPHVGTSSFASQAFFASASGTLAGSSTAAARASCGCCAAAGNGLFALEVWMDGD